jgi:hypothetical protein
LDNGRPGDNVKKPVRATALVAFAIFCLLAVALCFNYVLQLRLERHAEALLNDVRSLRLEVSTAAEVRSMVEKYHGSASAGGRDAFGCDVWDASYSIRIVNDALDSVGLRYPFLRFAVKPQGVEATFMVNQGRLHCMWYRFASFPPHDWKQLVVEVQANSAAPGILWASSKPFVVEYPSGKTWFFFVNLKPDATEEELRLAFDFNLSCMRRFGGCGAACELMPTAWQEYLKKAQERSLTIPRHELDDGRCVNRVGTDTTSTPD